MGRCKQIANTFLKQMVRSDSQVLYLLIALNAFIGVILLLINQFTVNYSGNLWFSAPWQHAALPLLCLSVFLLYFQEIISHRLYLIMYVLVFYCLSLAAGLILTQGIQLTPFQPIDHWLLSLDQSLGFNQEQLITFTYRHSYFCNLLIKAYDSITWQLVIFPFVMAYFLCERSVKIFLLSMLISYPIGLLIYYFFPATAPASAIHNAYFIGMQDDTYIKFYQIHHHLKITTADGGIIVVPSFHIIWATLIIYLTRAKKWLFYPVLAWNIILMVSTVALGWHYLFDVFAGLIVAMLSIYSAKKISMKSYQKVIKQSTSTYKPNAP